MKAHPWREVQEEARVLRQTIKTFALFIQRNDGHSGRHSKDPHFHRVPIGPALWDGAWRPL